ncbi:hypothetical protein [Sphingobacterium rhinopitheci]|uniref:hypothetical protein n=1 Tax=Sphingobacterium rhinopitheci TaxID=2781960 RepID=UPI001F527194|nr:hypothetical protein [Sphingobacterium rhinopitheci]MCI0921289.1 hypothetical protein [Sphingobacterium rhinopitheci]
MIRITTLLLLVLFTKVSFAQDSLVTTAKQKDIEFTLSLRSNQLWRGNITTDQPVVISQVEFAINKSRTLKMGIWGGSAISNNANGTQYKEIDYFIHYEKNGISIKLWDFFTSTNIVAERASDNIFNYSKSRTAHLLNLAMSYQLQNNFPLIFETDILVYGGANAREVLLNNNGDYLRNKYSTYVGLIYPSKLNDEYSLDAFIGFGFAFNPGDPNKGETTFLFGNGKNKFDIVNLGFTITRDVNILNKVNIPVSMTTLWNPSNQFARVQIAAKIF